MSNFEGSTTDEGRTISSTDRAGRTISTEYDDLGRAVKQIAPDGSFTTWTYDAAGRLIAITDALGNIMIHS